MALQHWYVTGLCQQGAVPSLVASVGDSSSSLLSVVFELNPEQSSADQLLRVHSQPVEITYDAVTFATPGHVTHSHQLCQNVRQELSPVCPQLTVNSVMDFFRTGKGVDLEVLTSATLSKLEEIKEKTAAGQSLLLGPAEQLGNGSPADHPSLQVCPTSSRPGRFWTCGST